MKDNWDPEKYDKHARFVSDLAMDLIELLELKGDERVLDVGCGDGALSSEIRKKAKDLIGIDQSPQMVKKAIQNGINAKVLDICDMDFRDEFDAVFSNAALHWVKCQEKALQNINRSLKNGGIFVAELGGSGNVETILSAIKKVFKKYGKDFQSPWYFPTPSHYKRLLEKSGFAVKHIELFKRDTKINDIENWLEVFAKGIASKLDEKERPYFIKDTKEILLDSPLYKNGKWCADYVRLRVKAVKVDKI